MGIGDDVDSDALDLIASLPSSDNTHKINSFDNLPDIAQEVAYDVCQVSSFDFARMIKLRTNSRLTTGYLINVDTTMVGVQLERCA